MNMKGLDNLTKKMDRVVNVLQELAATLHNKHLITNAKKVNDQGNIFLKITLGALTKVYF